ncbi:cyclophilin-like fold protein [uncultured Parasutterella sp.]|uniref:cyclophilin-like fold protein n=1 Tax=uncultured Parasutterella sp. TaxID=1263098 RepID=UPI002593C634|nr:cyclophilin-like fold protein [uncultured Parasutterella sp.]
MTARKKIIKLILPALAAYAGTCLAADSAVVYFTKYENVPASSVDSLSRASYYPTAESGVTAFVAQEIAKQTGSEIFSIKTRKSYPASFDEVVSLSHEEQAKGVLPSLESILSLDRFQTIYLGFPIWSMAMPQPVLSFIHDAKLEGKTVIPFCTHDGYGAGSSFSVLAGKLSQSRVLTNGLQIASSSVASAPSDVKEWLDKSASKVQMISCRVGGHQIRIEMNNTPEAREFLSKLPITVNMGEFGGREFYGPMKGSIKTKSKGQYRFEDGTLTYCPTNNTVALFYAQSSRPNLTMAVYPMGRVVSDLSVFEKLNSYDSFEFAK